MKRFGGLLALLLSAHTEGGSTPAAFRASSVSLGRSAATAVPQPVAVVTGDWNLDLHTDLAVLDSAGNRVSVLLGGGGTSFI